MLLIRTRVSWTAVISEFVDNGYSETVLEAQEILTNFTPKQL